VYEEFAGSVDGSWIASVARAALKAGCDEPAPLSIVIADDATLGQLNRTYRGLAGTTDVLSFSPSLPGKYYGSEDELPSGGKPDDFILPPSEQVSLGEVLISYAQAERQARAAGHTVQRELALLLAHGILHLLGYDHEIDSEAEQMRDRESKLMSRIETAGLIGA
jgi:probable rRNA maturation factor